jgi:hypothetical protein
MASFWWFMMPVLNLWLRGMLGSLAITRHVYLWDARHNRVLGYVSLQRSQESNHLFNNKKKTKSYTSTLHYTHLQATKKHIISRANVCLWRKDRIQIPVFPGKSSVDVTAERFITIIAARTSNQIMCP